jgi:hypothetical protein
MKSSLMKLNYVSTFSGKGQPVIVEFQNRSRTRFVGEARKTPYSVVKEQGRHSITLTPFPVVKNDRQLKSNIIESQIFL